MSIHVALNHVTHYGYDRLVSLAPQIVRLRPASHYRTPMRPPAEEANPDFPFTLDLRRAGGP